LPLIDEPVRLGGRVAPSRVLFGPHVTNLGRGREISARHVAYYAERAAGGAGVIVTEIASVHPLDHPYERAPLATSAVPGWRSVATACRPHGALVLAGLGHAGHQGSSAYTQRELWGAAAIPDVSVGEVPLVMEAPEIAALVDGFAAAARLAVGAGLDGVEINAGQHSLLRQFLSGLTNTKPDWSLLRTVLGAVRGALGDGVLGLRLCCDELAPWAGITPGAVPRDLPVDYLVPVRGSGMSVGATRPDWHTSPAFNRALCAGFRGTVPVVLQGSVTDVDLDLAQEALTAGDCDLVEMTRAQIADPALVAHVRNWQPERIRPTLLSNRWTAVRDVRNPLVTDDADPRSGHETVDPPVEGRDPITQDVLVVGGGPGGMEAARVLGLRGHRVRLVEQRDRLGGAMWTWPNPRAALLVAWWERELARAGVEVALGRRVAADDLTGVVLLATGGRDAPTAFPSDVPVWAASAGARPAGPVVVHDPVGDGTGCDIALSLGAAALVTPDPVAGKQLADPAGTAVRLERAGVARERLARLVEVRDGRAWLEHVWTGERRSVPCAAVIDCDHRLPEDTLWRARPDLPRIGDCLAPRTIHEAVREARQAALAVGAGTMPPRVAGPGESRVSVGESRVRHGESRVRHGESRVRASLREDGGAAAVRAYGRARTGDSPTETGDSPDETRDSRGVLHSPFSLGPLTLRNRIVFAAHLTLAAEDGLPTAQHAVYYGARAAGGAGLVITEEHSVLPSDQPYEKLIRGGDRAALPGYRAITDAVHAHDVPVLAQLNHNGGQSSGMYSREPVRAPSPIADPMFREVPVEVTSCEIAEIVDGYARTAALCVEGGFDGVELQCSHASILRQFLSPLTNRRTDGYGGSIEHRSRIVREVAAAVRDAIGNRVLGVRLCGDEGLPGGTPVEEAVATARLLAADGTVTYVNTSVGVATSTLHMIEAPMAVPAGYALPVAAAIRHGSGLPTIGIGRFTTHAAAEAALAEEHCDLVGVVRGQIADPAWAHGPTTPCLGCNQECVGRVGRNQRLGCAVNPRAGRESIAVPAPAQRRRVLVVGGGPAGLKAAETAARRGHEVVLCERAETVGGALRLAASAPYRGELGGIVDALHGACLRAGVEIRAGLCMDAASVAAAAPNTVVLATGAVPARPPWALGIGRIVDVRDVLSGHVAPSGEVLVHDELGSHEATSVAEFLAARGCRVEVSTPAMVVAQYLGTTLDSELFHRRAHSAGITLSNEQVVLSAVADGAGVRLELLRHTRGTTVSRRYDWVVCAVPPAPVDELWTALHGIAAPVVRIGDCLAPRRLDAAIRDGERIGMRP